jgi:ATP-dependent DNA helicase RecG
VHTRDEIAELIYNGENSFVEFKQDLVRPEGLAKEIVAFANTDGGRILLGVDDAGVVVGLQRFADARQLEEWVMQIARDSVRPPLVPAYQRIRSFDGDREIAVITIAVGLDVYARWYNGGSQYYIRAGSTSREASAEELQRLFARRGRIRAELLPVVAATVDDLDLRRVHDYFARVRGQQLSKELKEVTRRLRLAEYMTDDGVVGLHPNVAGTVLFGEVPNRYVTGAVIDAAAFSAAEASISNVLEAAVLSGPAVRLEGPPGQLREPGIVEAALDFVHRHSTRWLGLSGATRIEGAGIPTSVIREALVNAIVHRDYTLSTRPIQLRIYPDRIEVLSPGRLPNGITIEAMQIGARASRNQLIVDTMRDYGYVERLGLGVPQMFREMQAYNGTRPGLLQVDETFVVTLLR